MTYERPREKQWLIHPAADHPENGEAVSVPDSRDRSARESISVIGADIVITGNIEATVDLHIEGRVTGDVRCSTLVLGENSIVTGKIFADRVRVSGTVDGAIDTRDLAVETTARVSGDVSYERLRVANGGYVEGNLKRKPGEERPIEPSETKAPKMAPPSPPLPPSPPVPRVERRIERRADAPGEVKIFE